MIFIGVLLVIIIVLIVLCSNKYGVGVADQRNWYVIKDFNNHQAAAELLASVNVQMIEFMRTLRDKYHIDAPDDIAQDTSMQTSYKAAINSPNDIYNIVGNLLNNYNPDVFYENDPRGTTETSFTIKKGESMYVCLRDKTDPTKLVDKDILLFVMLHEASHIANYRGWGHGVDFWEIFAFILHEAQLAGIYTPVDYSKTPKWYCGLLVEYNPLYDKALRKIWL